MQELQEVTKEATDETTEEATKYKKGRTKITFISVEPMEGLVSKSIRVKPALEKELTINKAPPSQIGRGQQQKMRGMMAWEAQSKFQHN